MHTAWFQSTDPLTQIPRTLDVVRRMGFELCALDLDGGGGGGGHGVSLTFRVRGHLSAANLADRLGQIPGIEGLVWRRGARQPVALVSQQPARADNSCVTDLASAHG